ncbi:hypothetical protein VTJ04DRAFT_9106 [Mycothermus thermophilus]|uniref:uncharacterized protein n=1 Tax=Humicola insolens TaxID=85995 RepID=UPI003743FF7F
MARDGFLGRSLCMEENRCVDGWIGGLRKRGESLLLVSRPLYNYPEKHIIERTGRMRGKNAIRRPPSPWFDPDPSHFIRFIHPVPSNPIQS